MRYETNDLRLGARAPGDPLSRKKATIGWVSPFRLNDSIASSTIAQIAELMLGWTRVLHNFVSDPAKRIAAHEKPGLEAKRHR
jgi:hypothetical protein